MLNHDYNLNFEDNNKKVFEPMTFFDDPSPQAPAQAAGMTGNYTNSVYQGFMFSPDFNVDVHFLPYDKLAKLFTSTPDTEVGCAKMIADFMCGNFIYVPEERQFYMWTGRIWMKLSDEHFKLSVMSVLENRYEYVEQLKDFEGLSYVKSCCNNGKIQSIISVLQSMLAINACHLNNDAGLLCVRNGVISFNEYGLYPHESYKNRYLTSMINVDYIPGFRHPIFDNFINSIMDFDIGRIEYLKTVFGYAVIGSPREQLCFILKGTGANGKTTLIDSISNVLTPSYCCTVPKNIITRENNRDINASSSMYMRLRNKRVVFTSELGKDDSIAGASFKKLIGGGRITAREVYKAAVEFDLTATLIIDSNYLPKIESACDEEAYAIKRRMVIIPFNHRFAADERDVSLPQKLSDYAVQSAILAWIIEGALTYMRYGLRPTQAILYELNTYMESENSILQFFNTCVTDTGNPNDFTGTGELYRAYVDYCIANNLKVVTSQKFAKCDILKTKQKSDKANARGYCCMTLR